MLRAGVHPATAASPTGHSLVVMLWFYRQVPEADRKATVAKAAPAAFPRGAPRSMTGVSAWNRPVPGGTMKHDAPPRLLTRPKIGTRLQTLFSDSTRRRVAISAFIGKNAADLLGTPKHIEVYCWPSATGTSALGVEALLRAGATVNFVDDLHTKLYWAEGSRCLIGSANLSSNGVGGGLVEHMIELPSTAIDIDEVLASIKPKATPVHLGSAALHKLRKDNEAVRPAKGVPDTRGDGARAPAPSFAEWWEDPKRYAANRIRLSWFSGGADTAESTKRAAREAGHTQQVTDWLSSAKRSTFRTGDWILYLETTSGAQALRDGNVAWMRVHGLSELTKAEQEEMEETEHPYVAFQVGPRPTPPFALDPRVKRAIQRAWAAHIARKDEDGPGEEKLARPPTAFWNDVHRFWQQGATRSK